MRKILLSLTFIILASTPIFAQDATLSAPVSRTAEAKYKIRSFNAVTQGVNSVQIDISVQDASNNEIRVISFNVPDAAHPGATFLGLVTAMITVRASETGNDARKVAFRILSYLSDQLYFPASVVNP